ncbi:hypothetical protein HYH03_013773 [Edaphochlamys debaryana]|uniref:Uncharacterized protein n=1 Tax=Edaphochlamys debaryana TaxID=47281 RepID=A0A835XQ76_9CHLO|nr:hypothetical protein HYH03_013773 [Edaphochlamys debaryana]|eukprot:KAG2487635.1 hypothetical protein HYH03_013773 [Edaphochlamys debaryana]
MENMNTLKKTITRNDNTTNPAFRHTYNFHQRPQWEGQPALISAYTNFHGEVPELPKYVPKYQVTPETATLASRHGSSPYSFYATAKKEGVLPDGRATYRFSGSAAGLPDAAATASAGAVTQKVSSSTLGSSGLPPVQYKSYLTEYVDEYREPVEQLDTMRTLTHKYNTVGGTRVTKRSTRSDGLPKYESRVVAF